MKIIIYGMGKYFERNKGQLPADAEIVAYVDKRGGVYDGKNIIGAEQIRTQVFDYVYIATRAKSMEVMEILMENGIPTEKIRILGLPDNEYSIDSAKKCIIIHSSSQIRLSLTGTSDLSCFGEVFEMNCYGINIPYKNTIVVDFGMNIGTASLYFAQNENVEKVYAFEPFQDTYEQALYNISLNDEEIRKKIITHNLAVSNYDETVKIPVLTDFSGGRTTEVQYLKDDSYRKDKELLGYVEIQYRDAAVILGDIMEQEKGKRFILKIDVEGSEFAIFESLKNTDLLGNVDGIVMEYHRDPAFITDVLEKNAFRYVRSGRREFGLIYAIRQS